MDKRTEALKWWKGLTFKEQVKAKDQVYPHWSFTFVSKSSEMIEDIYKELIEANFKDSECKPN